MLLTHDVACAGKHAGEAPYDCASVPALEALYFALGTESVHSLFMKHPQIPDALKHASRILRSLPERLTAATCLVSLYQHKALTIVDDAPAHWADFICNQIQEGTQVRCCSESHDYSHHFLLLVQKVVWLLLHPGYGCPYEMAHPYGIIILLQPMLLRHSISD